jgi:uncharacterized protein YndB with AHSA1/START domain
VAASAADQARTAVLVAVDPPTAFRVFTEEIDLWWRRGLKYRLGRGAGPASTLRLEPGVGGRLYESFDGPDGQVHVVETGRVERWEPPGRLVLSWRAANFAPGESTEVEVSFAPTASGTLVTVTHRGWSAIRPDHPVRHGEEVAAFLRTLGLWWGELLSSLRERLAGPS